MCINFMHHDASMAECDNGLPIRERSLTIGVGGGGGALVLFQTLEPKNFSPSQVNSPKILAPFKM